MRTLINSFRQARKYEDVQEIAEGVVLVCFFGVAIVASVGHVV